MQKRKTLELLQKTILLLIVRMQYPLLLMIIKGLDLR